MYTIEIRFHEKHIFLKYLGDHIENQPVQRFFAHVQSADEDQECVVTPGIGQFDWYDANGEKFGIEIREEGRPTSCATGIDYYMRILVSHSDLEKVKGFVKEALLYTRPTKKQQISIYYSRSKGYWEHFNTTYAQTIDKIYIDPVVKNEVIGKLDAFIGAKQRYIEFGRPYKINFLLTGVPGAGKTSLVKAIALKYKRKINVLNFSKGLTDETLVSLMSEIRDNEIVLMEDIDAFFVDREATSNNGVSFSALLNIMDGTMMKGNGTMMFLTANNPDRLDKALIRPGRIDHVVKFDFPRPAEIREAFRDITGCGDTDEWRRFFGRLSGLNVNMSSIIDFLFRYPGQGEWEAHIEELLEQTALRQEITNDAKIEKIYM